MENKHVCPECKGSGEIKIYPEGYMSGYTPVNGVCPNCSGTGHLALAVKEVFKHVPMAGMLFDKDNNYWYRFKPLTPDELEELGIKEITKDLHNIYAKFKNGSALYCIDETCDEYQPPMFNNQPVSLIPWRKGE